MPKSSSPLAPRRAPVALQDRALADLAYVRDTLDSAGRFTAVPGLGGVGMGACALVGGGVAAQLEGGAWFWAWGATAAAAAAVGAVAMVRKARRSQTSLARGAGRKFLLGMVPVLLCGALISGVVWRAGAAASLPGVWLLHYGAAVVAGGAHSIRPVPLMGTAFMALGAVALALPGLGDLLLLAGFAGLHLGFGALIWRRHGG